MTRIFDVSARFPEDRAAPLKLVLEQLRARGYEPLVVGALARDIVTHFVGGSTAPRATYDIDMAVSVATPEEFDDLLSRFERDRWAIQRIHVLGTVVDIVPFGGIADAGLVALGEGTLDVNGVAEASVSSVRASISRNIEINVASLPALCILKVLAWRDRRASTHKDALDLKHLLLAASDNPYVDELFEDECFAEAGYDLAVAGAVWVGRNARTFLADHTVVAVLEVLEHLGSDLADDMRSDIADELLHGLERGLR